jgi:hypothetical protein
VSRAAVARALLLAATLILMPPAVVQAGAAISARAPVPGSQEPRMQPAQLTATLGDRFTLHTIMSATASSGRRIAHLNVVSLDPDVYVDPEDWSPQRSRYLDTAAAGPAQSAQTLDWQVQAVSVGRFDVYVVVLLDSPDGPANRTGSTTSDQEALIVSGPTRMTVTSRVTINPGNSLTVAIAVPLLIAVTAAATRYRRRRGR